MKIERGVAGIFSLAFGMFLITSSTWKLNMVTSEIIQQQAASNSRDPLWVEATIPWGGLYLLGGGVLAAYGCFCVHKVLDPDEETQKQVSRERASVPQVQAQQTQQAAPASTPSTPAPTPVRQPRSVPQAQPPQPEIQAPVPVAAGGNRLGETNRIEESSIETIVLQPVQIKPSNNLSGLSTFSQKDMYDVEESFDAVSPSVLVRPEVKKEVSTLVNPETDYDYDFYEEDEEDEMAIGTPSFYQSRESKNFPTIVARCGLSILVSAASRAGKTVFWFTTMLEIERLFPGTIWRIFDQKNRTWLGLETDPTSFAVPGSRDKYRSFYKFTIEVQKILDARTNYTNEEIKDLPPVYLVLDDYFNLLKMARQSLSPDAYNRLDAAIGYIVTMGAAFKVFVVFLTQTHNVTALGDWADKNNRESLAFISLGRTERVQDPDTGEWMKKGNYVSVSSIVRDVNIITHKATRDTLSREFASLQKFGVANERSIGFTTILKEQVFLLPTINEADLPPIREVKREKAICDSIDEDLSVSDVERQETSETGDGGNGVFQETVKEVSIQEPLTETLAEIQPEEPEVDDDSDGSFDRFMNIPQNKGDVIDITEDHLAIMDFAEKSRSTNDGWITARNAKSAIYPFRKRNVSPDEIRIMFVQLQRSGAGETQGEKESLVYRY